MSENNSVTKIYLTGFTNPTDGDVTGQAVREDGVCLAGHLSSNMVWAKHDLGLTSDWKHEIYKKACPKGYELIWIDNPHADLRWQDVLAKNKALEATAKGGK